MLLKILLVIAVIALVYFFFFKKSDTIEKPSQKKKNSEEMVACESCGTYISANDALIKSGKYYCSSECMEA